MAVAASTMILRSLRMTGEKVRGATLTTDEQTECLAELNSMMDSLSIEGLLAYQQLQESFSLTANTVSYTIGSGATFNTTRPTKIIDPCFIRDSASLDSPVRIVSDDSYGKIVQKNVGQTYANVLFYDRAVDSSGYGTIKVYPAPNASLTLFINSIKQLQSFANLSTQVNMPPGYQLMIESNLAIHMAAGFIPVSAEVAKIARESKAAVKSMNLPITISRLDAGVTGGQRMNILTGP